MRLHATLSHACIVCVCVCVRVGACVCMCVCARARGTVRPGAGRDSCVHNVWCRCSVCMCVFLNEGSISYFIRFMSRVSAGTHLRTLTYSRLSSLLFKFLGFGALDLSMRRYTIPRCLGPPLHTQRQRRTGDDDHPSGALILNSATVSYPYTVVTSRQDRNPRSHPPPLAHGAPRLCWTPRRRAAATAASD
jgi:hypothetical protein